MVVEFEIFCLCCFRRDEGGRVGGFGGGRFDGGIGGGGDMTGGGIGGKIGGGINSGSAENNLFSTHNHEHSNIGKDDKSVEAFRNNNYNFKAFANSQKHKLNYPNAFNQHYFHNNDLTKHKVVDFTNNHFDGGGSISFNYSGWKNNPIEKEAYAKESIQIPSVGKLFE